MNKWKATLAAFSLALCSGLLVMAACSPNNASSSSANSTTGAQATTTDATEASSTTVSTPSDYESNLYAQIAENQQKYAPKVKTLEDGTKIQLTPSDSGIYNTYFLNADNRGCESCHDNLYQTMISMPASIYWQPETHMHVIGLGQTDISVMECVNCHSTASAPKLKDAIHGIHSGTDATCQSCHIIGDDGSYQMWDYGKYDLFMGLIDADASTGTFSFDQDVATPSDEIFTTDWRHYESDFAAAMQLDGYEVKTDESELTNWTIKVDGKVNEEKTYTMGDLINMGLSETKTMTMCCEMTASTGSTIANVEVTGIPVKKVLDLVGYDASAGYAYAKMNEWYPYETPVALENLADDDALLVYKVNGEYLTPAQGWPVQIWTKGMQAQWYVKRVCEITVGADESSDTSGMQAIYEASTNGGGESTEVQPANSPMCKILNTKDGQIINPGNYTFEGYAYASEGAVTAVQISLDRGTTWTTFDTAGATSDRWVYWKYSNTFDPGAYVIYARTVSEKGYISPVIEKILVNVQSDTQAEGSTTDSTTSGSGSEATSSSTSAN